MQLYPSYRSLCLFRRAGCQQTFHVMYSYSHIIPFHLFTNDHLAQVLRNAGSKVKLLIARDVTKDNHLSSPILSQDSSDGKVCLRVLHVHDILYKLICQ